MVELIRRQPSRRCHGRVLRSRRTGDEGYDKAVELIERYEASHRLRTLDSLQRSVALSLTRSDAAESVVAADKILCKVAALEVVSVTDPESGIL
jgi:hypothetical protein